MSAQLLAEIGVWLTVLQWMIVGVIFFYDCVRIHLRAKRQYENALETGNGRVIVAKYRLKISSAFLWGSSIALALGFLRVGQLTIDPPPVPEFRIIGSLISEGIVLMLWKFWRAKRYNVILQRVVDERRYEETGRS